MAPLCNNWNNLYKKETFEGINITQQHLNVVDPVEAFVYMELLTVKNILATVNESITTIAKILSGSAMLTDKSQREATQLMKGVVPESWERGWEGPESPMDWIILVNRKAVALLQWLQRTQQKQLLEHSVNLSDLFHPETFLNALRQRSARQLETAIDELKLVSSFESGKVPRATTVMVEGLWLQGCDFDGKRTCDLKDAGQTSEVIQLPVCYMAWVGGDEPEPHADGTVVTPIYHTLNREKLLCTINVPNVGAASTRIISGVALFLNGSE